MANTVPSPLLLLVTSPLLPLLLMTVPLYMEAETSRSESLLQEEGSCIISYYIVYQAVLKFNSAVSTAKESELVRIVLL